MVAASASASAMTPDKKDGDELERSIQRVLAMVPKPKKPAGSPAKEGAQKDVEYHTMCSAIRTLLSNQHRILFLNGVLLQALSSNDDTTDDAWLRPPKYVCNIDKGWMAQWMVKNDPSDGLSIDREFLDNLESQDARTIGLLFQMFTGTAPYTEVPELMRNSKSLTGSVFAQRANVIGNFMKDWRKQCCTGNVIDMKKGAAYQITFPKDAAFATEVTFMRKFKAEINPEEVRISTGFEMRDPFSIQNCTVVKGMSRFKLIDSLSAEQEGPKTILVASGKKGAKYKSPLQILAEEFHTAEESRKTNQQYTNFDESASFVGEARRQKQADKLKAASERAQASLKRKRTIALT